jgi:signal transduction histidine kinase
VSNPLPTGWFRSWFLSARLVSAAIIGVSLVAGAMVFVFHAGALARLNDRILEENRVRRQSALEHVQDYFNDVYSTLLFVSQDQDVKMMRKGSDDFIQRLYDHQWDQHHLAEIYVVQRDFSGNQRPFLTFEREETPAALEELHSPARELEEYQTQRNQIQQFLAHTNLLALLSPQILLCVNDAKGHRARGRVYSVPIRSTQGLMGIVAGMIPTQVVSEHLRKDLYQQAALLVNNRGDLCEGPEVSEDVRSWVEHEVVRHGPADFFAHHVQGLRIGRWRALWAPVNIVCGDQWWLIFLYDTSAYSPRGFLAGSAAPEALAGMLVVAGIALALLARTTARRLEDKVRFLNEREQLERLVQAASEREQRRIGEQLREDLCQRLAGLEAASHALAKGLKTRERAQAGLAAEIATEIRESVGQARQLADELEPVALLEQGLSAALETLTRATQQRSGIECRFEGQELPDFTDASLPTHLYRIAAEALANAVQHAQARHIGLRLSLTDHQIVLAVSDDGAGMPPDAAQAPGMGLRIMRYRCDVIGAALDLKFEPGKGTQVICRCPVPEEQPGRLSDADLQESS